MHPKQILDNLGASPQKKFSQNFLTSPHWAENLVKALLTGISPEEIWEIGPGLGALTRILTQSTEKPIRLFEIDRKICGYLRNEFPNQELVEGDFLKWEPEHAPNGVAVLGNLPYKISSSVFFKLLERRSQIVRSVLTFQKEFAQRLTADASTPEYGGVSVMAQTYYSLTSLGTIPPGAFYPRPEISSQAVLFIPKTEVLVAETELQPLVRVAFSHRRKMLIKNLAANYPRDRVEEALAQLGHTSKARAEELSPEEFCQLSLKLR